MKPIAPNTLLQNRYLIVQLIGKGGMGEVYLAVDQRLGSAIALKRTFFTDDITLGTAFEREAKILARLRHPALPKVSDHFNEEDTQYLVMEHISGEDLAKRLEVNQKPFPLSWVLFWADQLLDALTYLHTNEPPIVHRDIKPQNLKLTDENNIVLLDFGLSKNTVGETRTSTSGSVVGYTPHYAPMEQIRGTGTDGRSDIFSLSATLYQLLTNVVPADALTRADALLSGWDDPIKPISAVNSEVSPKVSDVIIKGMAISQDQRYANAREMQKALREAFLEVKESAGVNTVVNQNQTQPKNPQSQFVTEVISLPPDTNNLSAPSGDQHSASERDAKQSNSEVYSTQNGDYKSSDEPDFDATLRYDHQPESLEPKQSNIQTEVFIAGSIPAIDEAQKNDSYKSDEAADGVNSEPNNILDDENYEEEDFAAFDAPANVVSHTPDATVPLISYDNQIDETPPESTPAHTSFDSLSIEESEQINPPSENHFHKEVAVAPPITKKSSAGKGLAIAGSIGALFFLILSAAGIGWFVLSGKEHMTENATPIPTPREAITATPSPEPTLEVAIETNSNTVEDSNSSEPDSNVETIAEPIVKPNQPATAQTTPERTSTTRPTPQIVAAKTPIVLKTPMPKKTPVKNDRTGILQ